MGAKLLSAAVVAGGALVSEVALGQRTGAPPQDLSHVSETQCKAGFATNYGISREQFDRLCQRFIGLTPPTSGAASGAISTPDGAGAGAGPNDPSGSNPLRK